MTTYAAQNEIEAQQFTLHFLKAFENLDMPTFIACFAEDATAFFPSPEPPLSFVGKPAIREQFEVVFAAIRNHASAGPPFHRLDAQDLLVQIIGAETALVSFHLKNSERIARRTLVLVKIESDWRIIHLHASNVAVT
jgi:ketosteroid isomerase-like protein